jgi:hypothetical protein
VLNGETAVSTAQCPAGKVAISGGYIILTASGTANGQIGFDRRVAGNASQWQVEIVRINTGTVEVQATTICVPGT